MKFIVKLFTGDYRGDHTADVCELHEAAPGETVEQLVARLLAPDRLRDRIEIQMVRGAFPSLET